MQATLSVHSPSEEETEPGPLARILCVDDVPANLLALQATLSEPGVEVVPAASGLDALRRLLQDDFALILMDVSMPDMDGFEAAELIRQRPRSQHTPIIFLTASQTDELQVFRGYAQGGVDYLCKPIVPEILRSKVNVFVDIYRKAEQLREQAELVRRMEELEHERELANVKERYEADRLRQEIELARHIQQKLFPAAPLPFPGFDISGASCPAEATGGDYFDYIPLRDGTLGLVVADVSGHGFGPALLMAELRAYLRAFLLARNDVGEVVSLLNRALLDDAPAGYFATLLFGKLDPKSRVLTYASAGHVPGYVLDASGEIKSILKATGLPLGVLAEETFLVRQTPPLEPGDVLLLLTDGIQEAHGPDQQLFGIERVLDTACAEPGRNAREMLDELFGSVRTFCGTQAQLDDMTAIVIRSLPVSL